MAKLSMSTMWRSGVFTGKYDAQFIAPIHDEVVFSVHKDQAAEVIPIIHGAMVQNYAGMVVPLVSEITIGRNFCDMVTLGTEPDAERTKEIVDSLFEGV